MPNPVPKPERIVDRNALEQARLDHCEYCGMHCNTFVHHVKARGMGGGSRMDVPENLVALCLGCHYRVHNGNIDRREIEEIVRKRSLH